MNEVNAAQALVGDPLETSFPRYYQAKQFTTDVGRLRDLARLRTRQALTEAEIAEVRELRKKIRRADADSAILLAIDLRLHGGSYPWI